MIATVIVIDYIALMLLVGISVGRYMKNATARPCRSSFTRSGSRVAPSGSVPPLPGGTHWQTSPADFTDALARYI